MKKELYEAPVVQVINMEVQGPVMGGTTNTDGLGLPGYPAGSFPES